MLDGSSIKAAREAKGMTQAELADKIGVAQQTVDKIERGVMRRTTFLPEIQSVLAGSSISPLQVLRTILCANPSAEQVMAALAANGLKIVPADAQMYPADEAIDDPIAFVRDVIARRNISASQLAIEAGISPSTLNRALNDPNHTCILSSRTLRKIKEWDHGRNQTAGKEV